MSLIHFVMEKRTSLTIEIDLSVFRVLAEKILLELSVFYMEKAPAVYNLLIVMF